MSTARKPKEPRKPKLPKKQPNPCEGCPCEHQPKVLPEIPDRPILATVGIMPGKEEVAAKRPNVGASGTMLRQRLALLGLDPVAHLNAVRCVLPLDPKQRSNATRRCRKLLMADLARIGPTVPLVLFGNLPVAALLEDQRARKQGAVHGRGLWHRSITGAPAFVARHVAQALYVMEPERSRLIDQWNEDMTRMADRVHKQERSAPIALKRSYQSPREAQTLLQLLSKHPGPWAFDVESYDAQQTPSRRNVATDPLHPDFRVRGIAFGWQHGGEMRGAWVELLSVEGEQAAIRKMLAPVFDSGAEKYAFNGDFDENALICAGWVPRVRMRTGDPMLALVALSDGRHESLALEKNLVDLLGWPQPWGGLVDKSQMRALPFAQVADGAISDACGCLALGLLLNDRLAKGEYL